MTSATPAAITMGKEIPATEPVPMRSRVGSPTINVALLAFNSVTP